MEILNKVCSVLMMTTSSEDQYFEVVDEAARTLKNFLLHCGNIPMGRYIPRIRIDDDRRKAVSELLEVILLTDELLPVLLSHLQEMLRSNSSSSSCEILSLIRLLLQLEEECQLSRPSNSLEHLATPEYSSLLIKKFEIEIVDLEKNSRIIITEFFLALGIFPSRVKGIRSSMLLELRRHKIRKLREVLGVLSASLSVMDENRREGIDSTLLKLLNAAASSHWKESEYAPLTRKDFGELYKDLDGNTFLPATKNFLERMDELGQYENEVKTIDDLSKVVLDFFIICNRFIGVFVSNFFLFDCLIIVVDHCFFLNLS